MRLVVQRVSSARVEVAGEVVGAIDRPGLLILAGIAHDDQPVTVERLADKHQMWVHRFWWSASSRSTPILARVAGHPGAQRHHEMSASR